MKKIFVVLILALMVLCVLSSCGITQVVYNTDEIPEETETNTQTKSTLSELTSTPSDNTQTPNENDSFVNEMGDLYSFYNLKDVKKLNETSSTELSDYSEKFDKRCFRLISDETLNSVFNILYKPFGQIFENNSDVSECFSYLNIYRPTNAFMSYPPYEYYLTYGTKSGITLIIEYIPERYSATESKKVILSEFGMEYSEIVQNGEFLSWTDNLSGYEKGIIIQNVDGYDFVYKIDKGEITGMFVIVDDYMLCIETTNNSQITDGLKPFESIFLNDNSIREGALKNIVNALKNSSDSIKA